MAKEGRIIKSLLVKELREVSQHFKNGTYAYGDGDIKSLYLSSLCADAAIVICRRKPRAGVKAGTKR